MLYVLKYHKTILMQYSNAKDSYFKFNQTYDINQQNRRAYKEKISFSPHLDSLKICQVNMKDLSPNFFTKKLNILEYQKNIVHNKTKNYIQNSYIRIDLKLSKDQQLQNQLKKFTLQEIRIGRILQIMDCLAGLVSYRHCFGSITDPNPFTLVTGSVESFHLFEKINSRDDIYIEGFTNYTGKTSIQIEINLCQTGTMKINSLFIMISRDSSDLTKGYPVPSLDFSNLQGIQYQNALIRRQQAEKNMNKRKYQLKNSYDKQSPSPEDIKQIHNIFLIHKKAYKMKDIYINQTQINNTIVMHSQQRNLHNKIFGGFLMREMLDIGWIAGNKFLKGNQFSIIHLTNIYFKSAVQIGTGLQIKASITYAQGNAIVVTVEAHTLNFSNQTSTQACYLHIILHCETNFKAVYPQTYQQALHYLSSKKVVRQLIDYSPSST